MFNPNAVTYLTAKPTQQRVPQRGEQYGSQHTVSRTSRPTPMHTHGGGFTTTPTVPASANENKKTHHAHGSRHRHCRDAQTHESGANSSRFMKDGLHNLQTYFSTILTPQGTSDRRGYDAQTRDRQRATEDYVAVPREAARMPRNPTPVYQVRGASPTVTPAASSPSSPSSPPRTHHHHHHSRASPTSAAAVGAPTPSQGVAPAVLLQAVRRMSMHVIHVPAVSADESAEAALAAQSPAAAPTPGEGRGSVPALHEDGPLDAACRDVWRESVRAAGQKVPVDTASAAAQGSLVPRYFLYESDDQGNVTHLELTNFRGCSVCLKRFRPGEAVGELPCHHVYHLLCIRRWLHLKDTCPNCRLVINAALVEDNTEHHDNNDNADTSKA